MKFAAGRLARSAASSTSESATPARSSRPVNHSGPPQWPTKGLFVTVRPDADQLFDEASEKDGINVREDGTKEYFAAQHSIKKVM